MRCLPCDIWENSLAGRVDSYSRGPEENPRLVCWKSIEDCTWLRREHSQGIMKDRLFRVSQAFIATFVFAQSHPGTWAGLLLSRRVT